MRPKKIKSNKINTVVFTSPALNSTAAKCYETSITASRSPVLSFLFHWIYYFQKINWSNEMKQAAFKAFAALGANEEDIRKQVHKFR